MMLNTIKLAAAGALLTFAATTTQAACLICNASITYCVQQSFDCDQANPNDGFVCIQAIQAPGSASVVKDLGELQKVTGAKGPILRRQLKKARAGARLPVDKKAGGYKTPGVYVEEIVKFPPVKEPN